MAHILLTHLILSTVLWRFFVCFLQDRKLRCREVKWLAQSHSIGQGSIGIGTQAVWLPSVLCFPTEMLFLGAESETLTIHVKNKQTKKVSEAVANVSYLFLRRRGKTKKREEERKGKSKRSQTERRNRGTAGAAGSENFSGRTWISNGCSQSSGTCNDLLSSSHQRDWENRRKCWAPGLGRGNCRNREQPQAAERRTKLGKETNLVGSWSWKTVRNSEESCQVCGLLQSMGKG